MGKGKGKVGEDEQTTEVVKVTTDVGVVAGTVAGTGEMPPSAQEPPKSPPQSLNPAFVAQQWKPGQSGNPSGRTKSFLQLIREECKGAERELAKVLFGFATNRPELARRDKVPAREQIQALQELLNRIYGKPKDTLELQGAGGGPLAMLSMDERRVLYSFVLGDPQALPAGDAEVIEAEARALPMPGEDRESGDVGPQAGI